MSGDGKGTAVDSGPGRQRSVDQHLCVKLRLAHQRANSLMLEVIRPSGLTTIQYYALWKISESEPISQNHLGRTLGMDPATSQGVNLRLEHKGLISRCADPADGRRLNLRTTDAGKVLLSQLHDSCWETEASFLEQLSAGERSVFSRLIEHLGQVA
ncbi:MarR family winged helix-turn-helix transcriptional regulator [Gammaproteobacteria bacterium]|nr:MarR family winged helix-turn-helix transcriptional regulator [Gammaproteobacteria bacterium]